MKRKSWDKVIIKNYLETWKVYWKVICNEEWYMSHRQWETMTIDRVLKNCYSMVEDNAVWLRSDEMLKDPNDTISEIIDITNTP